MHKLKRRKWYPLWKRQCHLIPLLVNGCIGMLTAYLIWSLCLRERERVRGVNIVLSVVRNHVYSGYLLSPYIAAVPGFSASADPHPHPPSLPGEFCSLCTHHFSLIPRPLFAHVCNIQRTVHHVGCSYVKGYTNQEYGPINLRNFTCKLCLLQQTRVKAERVVL